MTFLAIGGRGKEPLIDDVDVHVVQLALILVFRTLKNSDLNPPHSGG
jgi:hypothetical protein